MEPRSWQDPPEYRGGGMGLAVPSLTPAVKLLLIANGVVFLFFFLVLDSIKQPNVEMQAIQLFALSPERWKAWFPLVPVWQLVTYAFMHGSFQHILYNMLGLYFLGTMLEGIIGTRRFMVFYMLAVVVAGFAQLMLSLAFDREPVPILGASGGVLAVICAMATLRPATRMILIIFPLTLRTLALIWVASDLFTLIRQFQGQESNVASFAHLTGAALGFAAVRTGWIWRDPVQLVEGARARRADLSEAESRARLDALLAKIAKEGIGSLTGRERSFLKKMSKRR
jgi:membrane associated rhomboid family serine protease